MGQLNNRSKEKMKAFLDEIEKKIDGQEIKKTPTGENITRS